MNLLTTADFWFGVKTTLFLYLLNLPLYVLYLSGLYIDPHIFLVAASTYIAAYWLACGRYRFTAAVYATALAAIALDFILQPEAVFGRQPIDISWLTFVGPAALLVLILYAATIGRGVRRVISVVLLLIAILVGQLYLVFAGYVWRLFVPLISSIPIGFPQPQDFPLYIVLYAVWKKIHLRQSEKTTEGRT